MNIRTILKNMDRSKKIGICVLIILTIGALCISAVSERQTQRELAEESAAWEEEVARMEAEEAARRKAEAQTRTIERIEVKADGKPLPVTAYLPTKIAGEAQSVELNAEIRLLGPGTELAEGSVVEVTLANDTPTSIMIWRNPIGEETPVESVNYTREELENGVRCVFTVAYGTHASVDFQFDAKIDEYNQGKFGFTAVRPADAAAQEVTHG